MPFVIQASLSVFGLTSEPHHRCAMVLASSRMPDLSPTREPIMPASSGPHTDGQRVIGNLHHIQVRRLESAKGIGKEVEFFGRRLRQLVGRGLVRHCQVHLHIARSSHRRVHVAARDHRPRKSGLGPVEVVLVARLAARERNRVGRARAPAGKHAHPLRHLDVHLRREPVGHVPGGREPARPIEQVRDRLLDRGQLQALHRAVLVARDHALIFKCPVVGLPLQKRGGRRHPNRPIGGPLARQELAGVVGDLGDLESWMKAKAHHLQVFRRGKSHCRLGRDVVRLGVKLRIDHVPRDMQCGPLDALRRDASSTIASAIPNTPTDLKPAQSSFALLFPSLYAPVLAASAPRDLATGTPQPWPVSRMDGSSSPAGTRLFSRSRVISATRPMAGHLLLRVRSRPPMAASSFIMDCRRGPSGSNGSRCLTILDAVNSL